MKAIGVKAREIFWPMAVVCYLTQPWHLRLDWISNALLVLVVVLLLVGWFAPTD
jgi:hypothetical protein